jgi:hypothetical protein
VDNEDREFELDASVIGNEDDSSVIDLVVETELRNKEMIRSIEICFVSRRAMLPLKHITSETEITL